MSAHMEPQNASRVRSRALAIVGILVCCAGVVAIVLTIVVGNSTYADAVANLQRAPVGCDTDFEFTGSGTFTFYVETKGRVGELRGDCAGADRAYSRKAGTKLPQVSLSLIDASGAEVALERTTKGRYDVDGFVGIAKRIVELSEPGKYTLSVASDESDFVISVGRDPKADHDGQQLLGLGGGIAAVVFGGIAAGAGLRRRKSLPPRPQISWAPPTVQPPTVQPPTVQPPTVEPTTGA